MKVISSSNIPLILLTIDSCRFHPELFAPKHLRIEMAKSPSDKDELGYIYTYEIKGI